MDIDQAAPTDAPDWSDPIFAPLAGRARLAIGQLGQSLDWRIATVSGDSLYVSCPEALVHLHRLRAFCDAVVVGIGTALADDPQLTVRHVTGTNPVRVVIDPSGRLPADARMLRDGCGKVVLICTEAAEAPDQVIPLRLPSRAGRFDPHQILAVLAERGLHRVLIEGGAHTISGFLAAGALDRLHIAVAPLLIGSGPFALSLPPVARLADALRPPTAVHGLGGDVLFDLDLAGARAAL